jgi:hypothetical protein
MNVAQRLTIGVPHDETVSRRTGRCEAAAFRGRCRGVAPPQGWVGPHDAVRSVTRLVGSDARAAPALKGNMRECPLLTQSGHRLIDPRGFPPPQSVEEWARASSCPTAQDRSPPMSNSRRIRDGQLVTRALVRCRFGIAGIITINLLLPHLHEGAGS